MNVLSSRILLRPSDLDRSRRFYRDVLGLAINQMTQPCADSADRSWFAQCPHR